MLNSADRHHHDFPPSLLPGQRGGWGMGQTGVDDFFADYRKLFNAAEQLIDIACTTWSAEGIK